MSRRTPPLRLREWPSLGKSVPETAPSDLDQQECLAGPNRHATAGQVHRPFMAQHYCLLKVLLAEMIVSACCRISFCVVLQWHPGKYPVVRCLELPHLLVEVAAPAALRSCCACCVNAVTMNTRVSCRYGLHPTCRDATAVYIVATKLT